MPYSITDFTQGFEFILHVIAEFAAYTLELTGIFIIMVGSVRAISLLIRRMRNKRPFNIVVDLGKSLSLALEFKMGAEIIKTVIVRNLEELAILAVVILIRALLAFIIHWEIKMERIDERQCASCEKDKE